MLDYAAISARFFAALVPYLSPVGRERVGQALQVIFDGHRTGLIFNVDYKDAKDRLSRAANDAWEVRMQGGYATGSGLSTPESRVVYNTNMMGLHDTIAAQKKLPKLIAEEKPSAAFQNEAYAFFDGIVPVALLVKDLKSKVVMGRKPNPEAIARREAQEAKKTIRTCAVCFRPIAVYPNGLIADHGYQLPHQWGKTASCYGPRFRPLEVSSDGLAFMIKLLTNEVHSIERTLEQSKSLTSISRTNYRREALVFTPESPTWAQELSNYKEHLQSELRHTKSSLKDYSRRLETWTPTPEGQRYSGGKRRHAPLHGIDRQVAEVRGLLRK